MQTIDLSPLHPYLRTKTDANKLTLVFEKLIDSVFKAKFDLSSALTTQTSYELNRDIEKMIESAGVNSGDSKTLEAFFRQIEQEISGLPVIHTILPFSPKEELIGAMHEWFYLNYKKTVLLEISVDPILIGGAVLSFGGRANDYSLRNKIDQIQQG